MKLVKRNNPLNKQNTVIVLFILVTLLALFIPRFGFDLVITQKIQSINSFVFAKVMWFVSSVGNQPVMFGLVALTGLFLYLSNHRVESVFSVLSATGSALSGSLIKILIDRPRPSDSMVQVSVWLSDKSYPSNHVLVFTVFFGFLLYLLLKSPKHNVIKTVVSILFFLFIATIGISRIYLGVHWASDVLGGYLLGIIWLIFTIRLYNSYYGKR